MVSRPTPERLARASRELNLLRHNHKEVVSAQQLDQREGKKYVPEMRATIDAIVDIFKQCFGTEVAELEKKTDFSKLAQAKMTEDNIGWKRMLNNRGRLKKWVDNVIQTKELWSVIPSFEDEQLESQLEEELEGDATSSDGSDCGSSSDDDEPLAATKNRHQQRHLKFWMESMKPLPKETEDEYAERVTLLVERGSSTRATRRKRAQGDPAPPVVDDLVAAGTEARLYYLQLKPDRKEPKPTKVLGHHDAGPKKGRQYEVEWKYPGCGPGKRKWVGPDHLAKWPDLVKNYNKVPTHGM